MTSLLAPDTCATRIVDRQGVNRMHKYQYLLVHLRPCLYLYVALPNNLYLFAPQKHSPEVNIDIVAWKEKNRKRANARGDTATNDCQLHVVAQLLIFMVRSTHHQPRANRRAREQQATCGPRAVYAEAA